jgi:pimeloyl-ACP methyl ester carboxylesterase
LRAHGGTGRIGPTAAFTFDGLADDVAALLDALNLTQPVLAVGISMGAGIALNLALRYRARIAALALVRPAWLDQPMPLHLGAYLQIAALLRTAGPATGLARFERAPSYRDVLARSPAAAPVTGRPKELWVNARLVHCFALGRMRRRPGWRVTRRMTCGTPPRSYQRAQLPAGARRAVR